MREPQFDPSENGHHYEEGYGWVTDGYTVVPDYAVDPRERYTATLSVRTGACPWCGSVRPERGEWEHCGGPV